MSAPSGFTVSLIGSTSFFSGLLASPPPIGNKTPNTGAFTALTTTGSFFSSGNVGIGTASPGTGTILDVQSTTAGVRFPNMTTTQKTAFTPAAGTVVFDTTLAKLCLYTGAAWQTITSV